MWGDNVDRISRDNNRPFVQPMHPETISEEAELDETLKGTT
jgi:hypothetical protein